MLRVREDGKADALKQMLLKSRQRSICTTLNFTLSMKSQEQLVLVAPHFIGL